MNRKSVEYLSRLGIDVWVSKDSDLLQSPMDDGNGTRSSNDDLATKRHSISHRNHREDVTNQTNRTSSIPSRRRPPSRIGASPGSGASGNKAAKPFQLASVVYVLQNVVVLDSLGAARFVKDILIAVTRSSLRDLLEQEFSWPIKLPGSQKSNDSNGFEQAAKAFSEFFHFAANERIDVSSSKLLVIALGQKAIALVDRLEENPTRIVKIPEIPNRAESKRALWSQLRQAMS